MATKHQGNTISGTAMTWPTCFAPLCREFSLLLTDLENIFGAASFTDLDMEVHASQKCCVFGRTNKDCHVIQASLNTQSFWDKMFDIDSDFFFFQN